MTGFGSELAAFHQRLQAAGLGRFADSLVQMARPSVRLVADPALPTAEPAASRLGGAPYLPASTAWPRNEDVPLSFIAQVNLGDISAYEAEGVLPSDGLLSFFYGRASPRPPARPPPIWRKTACSRRLGCDRKPS